MSRSQYGDGWSRREAGGQGRPRHGRGVGHRTWRPRRRIEADGGIARSAPIVAADGAARASTSATTPRSARSIDDVVAEHGRIDGVVTAAGVAGGGPVHLIDAAEWDAWSAST